jgi:hypothetical protein
MDINLNIPYLGINKQPVINADQSTQTIGAHFAVILASITSGDPVKFMTWANAIYQNEVITVDDNELKMLTEVATNCPLPAILRVQILQAFISK